MRSLRRSKGSARSTKRAPASSQAGRPATKRSSITQSKKGSATTGQASRTPRCCAMRSRSSSVLRAQQLRHRANDLQSFACLAVFIGVAQREGVEAGLRLQGVVRVGAAQRDARDAPAQIAGGVQGGFGGSREMCALERTDTEVDD